MYYEPENQQKIKKQKIIVIHLPPSPTIPSALCLCGLICAAKLPDLRTIIEQRRRASEAAAAAAAPADSSASDDQAAGVATNGSGGVQLKGRNVEGSGTMRGFATGKSCTPWTTEVGLKNKCSISKSDYLLL